MVSWVCPKCREVLVKNGNTLNCSQSHSYDLARQGYCNLLLANKKNSRQPGDSEEMVAARKQFLEAGYYDGIVDAVADFIQRHQRDNPSLMDMGCGEGYYLRALQARLPSSAVRCAGVDISKFAVKKAAAADKNSQFAVASCFDIPVQARSQDFALSVFSPVDVAELTRILRGGGFFIRVSPGPKHLWEIKEKIYDQPEQHTPPGLIDGFELVDQLHLTERLEIKEQPILQSLLKMTPFYWHGNTAAKAELMALPGIDVRSDFIAQFFRSNNHSD